MFNFVKTTFMNILITAATLFESSKIIDELELIETNKNLYTNKKYNTSLLICGVGIPSTMFTMLNLKSLEKFDLLINIGIAGSFNKNTDLGETFNITSDYFGDIGINDKKSFINVFNSSFNKQFDDLFTDGILINKTSYPEYFSKIEQTAGVTVNIPENTIFNGPEVETMEGAAFMMIAKSKNLNFIQIRSISNIVSHTKREDWKIKEAIKNYSTIIIDFIKNN